MAKFVAVSKNCGIIDYEIGPVSKPGEFDKVKILACRKAYRSFPMENIERLPCVVYQIKDDEQEEMTLVGVQVMVRGLPVQACDIDCVNFRDITIV